LIVKTLYRELTEAVVAVQVVPWTEVYPTSLSTGLRAFPENIFNISASRRINKEKCRKNDENI
jgi:hypothetical protein